MIFYQNQVILLKKHNLEPAIFLGYDKANNKKIWAVCIAHDGSFEIDWFMEGDCDYYHVQTSNKATPTGKQIFYGKYKVALPGGILSENPPNEIVEKYGKYILELIEKYSKEKENEQKS